MRYVGIAAYSGMPFGELAEAARAFIRELGKLVDVKHTAIVTGGYWGLMRVVVDAALKEGFHVVIIPPHEEEGAPFPEDAVVVKTGTSFRVRSVFLVRTSNVLVVLGGAAGSIQEAVTAYTEGVPILVLSGYGMPTDRLRALAPYLDNRELARIYIVESPSILAKAVAKVLKEVGFGITG